jgi:PAT family beta-lactamase induction signal transducer AmpG
MTIPSSASGKTALRDWRSRLPEGIRPYFEAAPLAALFLGISSGAAFSMIGATLTTRLAQQGITKSAVTAFALTILAYNFKFIWAPIVDNVRLPGIGRFGQRRSWLWLIGALVMVAVAFLGMAEPKESLYVVAIAAIATPIASSCSSLASSASAPACRSMAGGSARRRRGLSL